MPAGGLVTAAVIVGAGVMANNANKKSLGKMQGSIDAAVAELQAIGLPPDLSKEIVYKQFEQQGVMSPEIEQAIELSYSNLGEMKERAPELRDQQMQALQLIQQRGRTGLAPEDRAALNQVRQQVQRDAEAKTQQILQNFQARGQGGSGSELIASLQAGQGGADQASEQGDRIAAQASMNALNAMSQGGLLAGNMRQQDYTVDSSKASAQDELARFNATNSIGRQQRNVQAKNIAQASNLQEKQRIFDANTNMGNAELLRQQEAKRQFYLDKLAKAQAIANVKTGTMSQSMYKNEKDNNNAFYGGIASAAGDLAGAYGKSQKNKTSTAGSTMPEDSGGGYDYKKGNYSDNIA